jgi:acyl-coenzyme A thioesterase PaaI-like protein
MVEVPPELQSYVTSDEVTEHQRTIRRCAVLVREIIARLISPDLPSPAVAELHERLTAAHTSAFGSRADRPTPLPGPEVHPWIGHSNAVAPPMRFHLEGDTLVGVVECSEVYGGAGRVHGGVIAGLFDAVIATRGAIEGAPMTVNLAVNYRRPTPLNQVLRLEAAVDRVEGRKYYVTARLLARGVVSAEATGLLLPHRS